MAQIQSGATTDLLSIDATFKAARVSIRPAEVLGWYSVGAKSGALTGVAAAGPVFTLRNLASNPVMVRRLQVGFVVTTAFTTAQALAFELFFARAFTASDSAGTAIALTGSQNKHRTSLATPTSLDMRVAPAAALTPGTRVLDTMPLGVAGGAASALGAAMQPFALVSHDAGDYPVVLAQNEGLVLANSIAMGAAGVIALHVNIEMAEALAF